MTALFQRLTDIHDGGLVLLDQSRKVVLWNEWMVRASSIPAAAALGTDFDKMFPHLTDGRLDKAIRAAVQGMASLVSSALNRQLLPLWHKADQVGRSEPMDQVILVKPVDGLVLLQVSDISAAAHREALLRQQARTMEALAENYRLSELHNRAIVDNTADAIVTFAEGGAIGTYNPAAERIFGYAPSEIVGKSVGVLIPDLVRADGRPQLDDVLDCRREVTGRRKIGAQFPLELSVSAMELGGQRLFVAIAHDITKRKTDEAELKNQKEWLTNLINAMPDLICFKDDKGRWLVANQFYLEIAGLTGVDYQGKSAFELAGLSMGQAQFLISTPESDERAWTEGRPISYEKDLPTPDGGSKVFDMVKIPLFHENGDRKGLVLVGRDITERKLTAARIHHLAHHDSLSGLPNRVLFHDRLKGALVQAKRSGNHVALLFLDLDKFKDVNDTLGHHVGDLLLKAVARRLLRCVRETDTVARLGGDEFAVILTNLADPEGAAQVAEDIIAAVAEPYRLEEHEVQTSTSIGITLYPDDAQDSETLLKYADLAMFRSKAEGRNTHHFYVASMDAEVQARKILERDLRRALAGDQLELHYQPLIEVRTGEIVGCEALVRWNHPTKGWIAPGIFIPVAERSDLITPLGQWILHRACRQGRIWADLGLPPVKIAVNLSPAQFKPNQNLAAQLAEILAETGMDAERLQLEITEGIAMQNVEATIAVLQNLQTLGAVISIDDFGTGYSSLNYLKRFPVNKLKIDRSFVTDIGQHKDNAVIVKAIVDLGHTLGARVNVEGVETQDQLDFIAMEGVDEAQGFLFSRPIPPDAFAQLLARPPAWMESWPRMPTGWKA